MIVTLENGINLNIYEYGNKDGFAILFLHGNSEDSSIFDFFKDKLQEYHLIMVDSRGHGLSSKVNELHYLEMSEDINLLIKKLEIKECHIVGFSDGAILSLALACKYTYIKKIFAIGANINPSGLRDECIEYMKNENNMYSWLCLNEPNIVVSELQKINSRVIQIVGDNDLIKRGHTELINSNIKNSTIYTLKNSDHFIPQNRSEDLLKIIENELLIDVYFEDNHVIVVDKKAGILSQEDKTKDPDILNMVKRYLIYKYDKPNDAYLGLVQRLDRNVSGLMVFAKTSKAAKRLNEIRPEKTYLALVYGKLENKNGHLENNLEKDEKKMIAYEDKNGKEAILDYNVVKENENFSLLEVKIETGRFHQIRCQLSLAGHPIFNDYKYNHKIEKNDYSIGLDAYKVVFIHPISKEKIEISRLPNDENFNKIM